MAIGIPSIDRWLMYISEDEISLGKQNLASLSYQNYSMILSCENIILRKLLIVVDIKLLLLNDILAQTTTYTISAIYIKTFPETIYDILFV